MTEVSGGRVRERPRLGWIDGVQVVLGNIGMTVEDARQYATRIAIFAWRFTLPFLLGTVSFGTALPLSGGFQLERGGMPLHDAVGINCKQDATTENQGADIKYMG